MPYRVAVAPATGRQIRIALFYNRIGGVCATGQPQNRSGRRTNATTARTVFSVATNGTRRRRPLRAGSGRRPRSTRDTAGGPAARARWHHRATARAPVRRHAAAARCCWAATESRCPGSVTGRFLPPTGCSLRLGCAVDERYGASMHTSTLRGRGRASKLTWVSLGVGKHSATVPPSSARAPCRGPPAWRRCCNLVDLHPLSCSNALADP